MERSTATVMKKDQKRRTPSPKDKTGIVTDQRKRVTIAGNLRPISMMKEFNRLVSIIERLRSKDGCPWDLEQTNESLKECLIEEVYETSDAIETGNFEHLKEELGDLMILLLMHTQIAKEKGKFNIEDVLKSAAEKLTYRHPHVFGKKRIKSSQRVVQEWEKLKLKEGESVFEGVPKSAPALTLAALVQKRVRKVGFDWEEIKDVFKKIEEEIEELKEICKDGDREKIELEFGDILFAIVNLSRFLNIPAEKALKKTVDKFIKRFKKMENEFKKRGKKLINISLEEMDKVWEETKKYD